MSGQTDCQPSWLRWAAAVYLIRLLMFQSAREEIQSFSAPCVWIVVACRHWRCDDSLCLVSTSPYKTLIIGPANPRITGFCLELHKKMEAQSPSPPYTSLLLCLFFRIFFLFSLFAEDVYIKRFLGVHSSRQTTYGNSPLVALKIWPKVRLCIEFAKITSRGNSIL